MRRKKRVYADRTVIIDHIRALLYHILSCMSSCLSRGGWRETSPKKVKREYNQIMVAGDVFLNCCWGIPCVHGGVENGTCLAPGTTLTACVFTFDGDDTLVKQVYTDAGGAVSTYYFPSASSGQALVGRMRYGWKVRWRPR